MLEVCDLTKRYGNVQAHGGASFSVAPGRIVGFLGPNGAGKTTVLLLRRETLSRSRIGRGRGRSRLGLRP
jgi:ABC-type multidrug transport system ATPase subunit